MVFPKRMVGAILPISVVAAGLASGALAAQEPEPRPTSEIIVEAPRSVPLPSPVQRSPFTGAPIVTSTVRIPVFYNDLDPAEPRDQTRLMTRVQRVAQDVCKELDRIHPFSPDANCVSKAVASGSTAARAAIAAAAGIGAAR